MARSRRPVRLRHELFAVLVFKALALATLRFVLLRPEPDDARQGERADQIAGLPRTKPGARP